MNVVAIIQARLGSTRLPGKVLKKIQNKVVLDYVIDRLKTCKKIDEIVLAITTNKKDDVLEKYAKDKKINYIRGSEEDVLSRYYEAAKKYNADIIVRITSDCPLIDPKIVDEIITKHLENNADYTANIIERTYPRGLDTEVFNFNTLETSFKLGIEKNFGELWEIPFNRLASASYPVYIGNRSNRQGRHNRSLQFFTLRKGLNYGKRTQSHTRV